MTLASSMTRQQFLAGVGAAPASLLGGGRTEPIDQVVDVKAFGAVGDGNADDTAAVGAALKAVEANGGGTLWFPAGQYLTGPISMTSRDVWLAGAGTTASRLVLRGGAGPHLVTVSVDRCGISRLRLSGNSGRQATGSCLHLTRRAHWFRCESARFDDGAESCVSSSGGNQQLFSNCQFFNGPGHGFTGSNNVNVTFVCCTFEDCSETGATLTGSASNQLYEFYSCYIENNRIGINYIGAGSKSRLLVVGSYFNGGRAQSPRGIRVDGAEIGGWIVRGNRFHDLDDAFVDLDLVEWGGYNDFQLNQYTGRTPAPTPQPGFDFGLDRGRGFAMLEDGESEPTVGGWSWFRTANSSTTSITGFTGGVEGQEILVKVDDPNTSFRFSGDGLQGNFGADWSASQGDHVRCVFDGRTWICEVSYNGP